MAQADQTVQNDTFPNVRSDINNNLAALFSNSSGNSAPTTTVAHMDWIDTSGADPVWKKRNAANSGWITIGTIKTSTVEFSGANTLPAQSGNSGKYLTTDGTTASWGAMTGTGRLLRAPQILTSGTSYTTPADCSFIYVEAVGGGGGGGGAGSDDIAAGGGAGGYCAKYFTVSPSTSYSYAIGAGGAGGAGTTSSVSSGDNGLAGGNTTFTVGATTITAGGGGGGSNNDVGGAGGTCTNGDLNATGSGGAGGNNNGYPTIEYGAPGGASFFGGAGRPTNASGGAGSVGGGGAGAVYKSTIAANGGNGGAGLIRIWEYS